MNPNPIIYDPESPEALTLLNQECEFSHGYRTLMRNEKFTKGILISVRTAESFPFTCHTGGQFTFIRKVERQKKLAELLQNHLDKMRPQNNKISEGYFTLLYEVLECLKEHDL